MMFKSWKIVFLLGMMLGVSWASAQDFYYNLENDDQASTTQVGTEIIRQDVIDDQKSVINRLLDVFGLTTRSYQGDDKAVAYIRVVINYFLAIAGFVALVVVVYGFYMMFFSEQEAGLTKAKGILRGAFIAIAILATSVFIVNFLFGVFMNVRNSTESDGTNTGVSPATSRTSPA